MRAEHVLCPHGERGIPAKLRRAAARNCYPGFENHTYLSGYLVRAGPFYLSIVPHTSEM
jgi:hypothetical protein